MGVQWFTSSQDKKNIKKDTISYLTEKGYDTDHDIQDLYVVNMGESKVINAVVVTFEDESEADYIYTYDKDTKRIIQIDAIHKENKRSLKHLEQ